MGKKWHKKIGKKIGRTVDKSLGSPSHLKSSIPAKRHAAQARFISAAATAALGVPVNIPASPPNSQPQKPQPPHGDGGAAARAQAEAEARRVAEQLKAQAEAEARRQREQAKAEADARRRAEELLAQQRAELARLKLEVDNQAAARQKAEALAQRNAEQLRQQTAVQRSQLSRSKSSLETQLQEKRAALGEVQRRRLEIDARIASEEKDIAEFKVERADPTTKVIITLGMTGGGKSTLCNRLRGDESMFGNEGGFATSADGQSCTQRNSKMIVQVGQHRITVVDTPGFNDSFGRDRTHSNLLCRYLKGCGGINAFVLVRNGANVRFDAAFQAMLREYHGMFGDAFFSRLVIVATHIEGFIKIRFEQNQSERALRNDICRLFNVNIQIPVIPIGFEDYKASLVALANVIPAGRQEFRQIKSPIDELKRRQSDIASEERRANEQVNRVQTELNRVVGELSAL